MKTNFKILVATSVVASSIMFGATMPAAAYPVGNDTQILLSKTSAIRSGATIKVKAQGVDRGCEVTFTISGRDVTNEDYDIASAFAGNNYSTAFTSLSVPETPGDYAVHAEYESACHATGTRSGNAPFRVGKAALLTTPTFTALNNMTLVAKKPVLVFGGSLKVSSSIGDNPVGLGGQKVTVVVSVRPTVGAAVALAPITVTTANDGSYTGTQALTAKNLKGSYTVTASFAGDPKVFSPTASVTSTSTISIASVKANLAAAKVAAAAAAVKRASIMKLTRQ